jgi:hypothetical protein
MMKRIKLLIYIIITLIFLSGCAPKALSPVFFIPKDIERAKEPIVSQDFSVKVTLEKENVEEYITENNFQIALTESIKRANLFGSENMKIFELSANVYKASFPLAGATMTSELCAKYVLSQEKMNVWSKDICYKGVANWDESFFGTTRSIMAFNRANHGHMALLISSLREYLTNRLQVNK